MQIEKVRGALERPDHGGGACGGALNAREEDGDPRLTLVE